MKKTITLESKIKKYASLACGVSAVTGASAQVVYSDINPDMVLSPSGTSQYTIDLDNGGSADIAFGMFQGSQTGTYPYAGYNIPYTLSYVGGAAAFGSAAPSANGWMASSSGDPAGLSMGSAIGTSGVFYGSQGSLGFVQSTYFGAPINQQFGPTPSGNFVGVEKYLGVRFDISGSTYYGWVRIEMSADATTMTLKDYAYESTSGSSINAGDMGGGTSAIEELADQVSINNVYNKLNVKLDGIDNANLTVLGLDGKQHINQTIGSMAVVDLSTLTTGIYLVNVSAEEGTTTKKIYVK